MAPASGRRVLKKDLLAAVRSGEGISLGGQARLIASLSLPAIMAQLSSVVMQYIDASMVGRLGADASASIGLVSSSTWLFGGTCTAVVVGFSVLVAQSIGAGQERRARDLVKQSFVVGLAVSLLFALLGAAVSGNLPIWLRGEQSLHRGATSYFLIYALSLPVGQAAMLAGSMLQASGNMRTPSALNILMCLLDVVFNWLLIYPSRQIFGITMPGAGLGVTGAALGTLLARLCCAAVMVYALFFRSRMLRLRPGEGFKLDWDAVRRAALLSAPVAVERLVMSGAQVASTAIVAPLGNISIAANSFAITAESLCYMPGEGVAMAASTIIGQTVGAGRRDLAKRLGFIVTGFGMLIMTISGVLMYLFAEAMIGSLSSDPEVVALGTGILRIEAFAEPMYAASMVASGVFRGAGDTLIPAIFNFCSMWLVRIPLSALAAPSLGLRGVWIAMALELTVRGIIFLIRLARGNWLKSNRKPIFSKKERSSNDLQGL